MTDIVVKTRADFASEEDYRRYVEDAYCYGSRVECLPKGRWASTAYPSFDWNRWDYRVKEVPDSIDWDAVGPAYNWLARDEDGRAFLYPDEPRWSEKLSIWVNTGRFGVVASEAFSSYRQGTTPASQSLVKRPED